MSFLVRNVFQFGNNNVAGSYQHGGVVDEDQQVWDWLKKYEATVEFESSFPGQLFKTTLRDRVMKDKHFTSFLNRDSRTIAVVGNPGVGKTTTVRGMIDSLTENEGGAAVVTASMFYNRHAVERRKDAQHASKVMVHLLRQIVNQIPKSIKHARQLHQKKHQECPSADDCATVIINILQQNRDLPICVILDGVDECDDKQLKDVLDQLKRVQDRIGIGVLVTDRLRAGAIWPSRLKEDQLRIVEVDKAEAGDIESYIRDRLAEERVKALETTPSLLAEVVDTIRNVSNGMFLYAHLSVEYIITQRVSTQSQMGRVLRTIAQCQGTFDNDVFSEWLERVVPKNVQNFETELARRVFRTVRDAQRALSIPELQHAIAWDTATGYFADGRASGWDDIRRICGGLIVADHNGAVGFYHETLRHSSTKHNIKDRLPDANLKLTNICVQYLTLEHFGAGACHTQIDRARLLEDYPLLPYASKYWSWHFDKVNEQGGDNANILGNNALQFLKLDSNVELSLQMARHEDMLLTKWSDTLRTFKDADPTMFHELPIARMAVGLFDQLKGSIEESGDLNPFVACRTTGFHLACRHGFITLLSGLLKESKALECRDSQHRTPLHVAAAFGQNELVNVLLKHGARPDPRDQFGFSPLMSAALNGHKAVVELLMNPQFNVDINAQTNSNCSIYKRSALHIAASRNQVEVAIALLTHKDIKTDLPDSHGETALHLATKMGNLAMVRSLVRSNRDFDLSFPTRCHQPADSSTCDFCGRTVLHLASSSRNRRDLVHYLVKQRPDLCGIPDTHGRVPLHYAVAIGAFDHVDLLLGFDASQLNARDEYGWSPIMESIKARNTPMFEHIWDRSDLKKDVRGKDGSSLLDHAVRCGNAVIARIIQEDSPAPSRTGTHAEPDTESQPDDDSGLGWETVRRSARKARAVSPANARVSSPPRVSHPTAKSASSVPTQNLFTRLRPSKTPTKDSHNSSAGRQTRSGSSSGGKTAISSLVASGTPGQSLWAPDKFSRRQSGSRSPGR